MTRVVMVATLAEDVLAMATGLLIGFAGPPAQRMIFCMITVTQILILTAM